MRKNPQLSFRLYASPLTLARLIFMFPFCSYSNRGAFRERHERGLECGGRCSLAWRAWLWRTAKLRGSGAPRLVLSLRGLLQATETTTSGLREEREVNR